jgi:hypothetical protein
LSKKTRFFVETILKITASLSCVEAQSPFAFSLILSARPAPQAAAHRRAPLPLPLLREGLRQRRQVQATVSTLVAEILSNCQKMMYIPIISKMAPIEDDHPLGCF